MMQKTFYLIAASALLALLLTAGQAQETNKPIGVKALRELLEIVRAKHELPALGAAVVRSKGAETLAVVGVRKHDTKVAATDEDLFHLGSDTKPWTAFLIAWLIEQGLLDWDTPLPKVFPELADKMSADWKKVTVSHLLTHRAGLPENLPGGWWNIPRTADARKVVMKQVTAKPLEEAPGEKFQYSNLGYVALGAVAERVGKASWEALLKKAIFEPLEIKRVGFGALGKPDKIDQPLPHDAKGKPQLKPLSADNPPVMGPAGRLNASLGAWSRFVADQLKGARGETALLKPEAYKKLVTSPYKDAFFTFGGWSGSERAGRKPRLILSLDGTNNFNYSSATLIPEWDLAILTVTNQGGDAAEKACHEMTLKLLKQVTGFR